MCKFSAAEIVSDNLMTRAQIVDYLKDDFRVELNLIKRLSVVDFLPLDKIALCEKIPHHRYDLFFDRISGTLFIKATEGKLRVEHLKVEVDVLSEISGWRVIFEDSSVPIDEPLKKWLQRMRANLGSRKISGVVIGSMWNINFYLRFFAEGPFADKHLKTVDPSVLKNYVEHQLTLAVIEEEYLAGRLELNQTEKSVFQEGSLVDSLTITRTKAIQDRIEDFSTKIAALREKPDFLDYIKSDFIFFSDLQNGTSLFQQTLASDRAKIFEDSFLSYQLIDCTGKTYINFNWANAEVLGAALKTLDREFGIESLHMYGKCGSLSPDIKVGQLVAPIKTFNGEHFIDIQNRIGKNVDIRSATFIDVASPLLETKSWATSARKHGCDCVDMELTSVIQGVSPEVIKSIVYYVSDEPTRGMTLSDRLGMLAQRLECSRLILINLFANT
jgi:hypothetical protein